VPQTTQIIETLKIQLRAHGKTYKDLARYMKLSEAGVKKAFATHSLTLKRIESICDFAGFTLNDLFKMSEQSSQAVKPSLSKDQEEALVNDEKLYVVFYLLLSGISKKEISKRYKFESNTLTSLFQSLEKLKLVNKTKAGQFKLKSDSFPVWIRHGPLEKKYITQLSEEFIIDCQNPKAYLKFLTGRFTESRYQSLIEKMKAFEAEFTTSTNSHTGPEKLIDLGFLHIMRPWRFSVIQKYKRHGIE
jgi:DNA-binding Xre family transcriptional regulator